MYKAEKKISLMSFMSFSRPRPKPTCLRQADESNFFALHEQALHLRGFMRSSVGLSFFLPVTIFAWLFSCSFFPSFKFKFKFKFKKEWKSYLLTNQIWPCLYVLSLILSEMLFLSLLLPIISTWRCPTRKLLLLWTLYTNELNVF